MDRYRQRRLGWYGMILALAALGFLIGEEQIGRPAPVWIATAIVLILVGAAIAWHWPPRSRQARQDAPPRSSPERT